MAATYTLSGDTNALIPSGTVRITRARIVTNLPANAALVDTTGKKVHLGDGDVTVAGDGTFSETLVGTNATDLNVAAGTLRYQLLIDYTSGRRNGTYASGWFEITANANIADPGFLDNADPVAVASSSTYALEAKGYRDEAQAAVTSVETISGLTGEDAAIANRINTPGSQTDVALKATIAGALPTRLSSNHGIKGNGTDDDGAALNALLAAAATAGASVTLAAGAVIKTSVQIVIPSNTRLIGNGATIKGAPVPGDYTPLVLINGVSNVLIENLTIDGNKAAYAATTEWKHGIEVKNNADGIHFRRVTCTKNKGEGFALTGTGTGDYCRNITLEHCRAIQNHRNGLGIISASGVRVIGGAYNETSGAAPQTGIDVEPNTTSDVIEGIEFENVEAGNNTGAGVKVLLHGGARHFAPTFVGGRFHHNGDAGFGTVVSLPAPGSVIPTMELVGVTIDSNTSVGVDLAGSCADFRMIGCRVRNNGGRGVNVVPSAGQAHTNVQLISCTIRDNSQTIPGSVDGVRVDGSVTGFTMAFCRSTGTSQRYGVTTSSTVTGETYLSNVLTGNATGTQLAGGASASRVIMDGGTWQVGQQIYVAGVKTLGSRRTGWATATGSQSRATFDTASVTLPELAQRVKTLIDDLSVHGLIGP